MVWIVTRDQTPYGGKFVTRLLAPHPTLYVLLADT
jgi:hypothetical protein